MAAQYDVNLEKCALLKCLCGSAFAAWTWARNLETPSLKNISIESEMSKKKKKIEDVCVSMDDLHEI